MVGLRIVSLVSGCTLLALSACTVAYDENTDEQVTSVTQEGNEQIATWKNMLAADQAIAFDAGSYSKIEGDLQALESRLASAPDTETRNLAPIAASQVTLWTNIRDTQLAHGFVSDYLTIQENLFTYNMGLLTLYELSLKEGAGTGAAGTAVTAAQSAGPPLPKLGG